METLQETHSLKRTPLYDRHLSLGGKIIEFGGWQMPVFYTSIIEEHLWTRGACGVFDVSHLGELHVKGKGAFDFLQHRLTNDLNKLKPGKILYNLLCDESGLTLDDILVYQEAADDYYLIVNASNIEKDYDALLKYVPSAVVLKNQSDQTACIAVQGPKAEGILENLFGFKVKDLGYYAFKAEVFQGSPVWISRSGYTGEDGFEIFSPNDKIVAVWDKLITDGKALGAKPAGLGARNTLRLEAGNGLYGHEIDEHTNPLEAGLSWVLSFDKKNGFVGREALLALKEKGLSRKLIGFKMLDKPIARENYGIFKDGKKIGHVTSGSFGPTVGANIGMGYVELGNEKPGTPIEIEIHGRLVKAETVKTPFITLNHKKGLSK